MQYSCVKKRLLLYLQQSYNKNLKNLHMKSKILDIIGISAVVLCLIHCLLFPLLMIIPIGISHNPYIDLSFLIISAVVVFRITRQIRSKKLRYLFWISIGLISVSVFADILFEVHLPLIYVGAVGLIVGHLINFRLHKH